MACVLIPFGWKKSKGIGAENKPRGCFPKCVLGSCLSWWGWVGLDELPSSQSKNGKEHPDSLLLGPHRGALPSCDGHCSPQHPGPGEFLSPGVCLVRAMELVYVTAIGGCRGVTCKGEAESSCESLWEPGTSLAQSHQRSGCRGSSHHFPAGKAEIRPQQLQLP